ncbi:MAG: CHAT domain-containing tetratricopeptide repeat protein [Deltaproteobacteria bacterium]
MIIRHGNRNHLIVLLLLTFLLLFLPCPVSAQTLGEAERLSQQIVKLYQGGRYREAIPYAEKVLEIVKKNYGEDHLATAAIYAHLIALYESIGNYGKAEPLYLKILEIAKKTIGEDDPKNVEINVNLAFLYMNLGLYEKAEPRCLKAMEIAKKNRVEEHPDTAGSYNCLATFYYALGNYGEAERLYLKSLKISKKTLGESHPATTANYSNLAALHYTLGDYKNAERLFLKHLEIIKKTLGEDHPDAAASYSNLAALYLSLGNYGEAERLSLKTLEINKKTLGEDHPNTAVIYIHLAAFYSALGNYGEAERLSLKALEITKMTLGESHPATIASYNNLATVYLDMEKYDEALRIFGKTDNLVGLGWYYLKKGSFSEAEVPFLRTMKSIEKTGAKEPLIFNHTGLALSYEGQGQYAKAKEHLREAVGIIEKQWRTLAPQAKKDFLSGKVGAVFSRLDPYEGMVRVILKEGGKRTGNDSFTVAESVKGRLFLEMLAARQIRGKTVRDETLLKKEKDLREKLLVLRKRIEIQEGLKIRPPEAEIRALKDELAGKEKEYDAFLAEVTLAGSELSSLLTVDPISPSRVQSLLGPATTLLEYFTTKDRTYAWLVTKDDIRVYEMPIGEKALRERVDRLLLPEMSDKASRKAESVMVYVPSSEKKVTTPAEREDNRRRFTQSAQDFYRDIFSPFAKDIKTANLLIVPHGVLHKVPFAALSDGRDCLADRYALTILPSASVMEYVVKKRKSAKGSILTLANPKTDSTPLPAAEKEGVAVSKLFPTREVYIREKATETLAKKRSSSFNVIHFASHGEFNDRQPMQSGLLLAKDKDNDGYLQVHEVFGMDLKNANLVTLSACETALAKIQGGDDLVGLSRGFIYAGTPSLLATLWKVDDDSTAILMDSFYKNWLKGMSKSEALRQAQLSLKAMPGYGHPRHWAPFLMIGDWR